MKANANCKLADVPIGKTFAAQPSRVEYSAERGELLLLIRFRKQINYHR